MKQFQSSLMRRLALAESVAIIGILLAFIAKTVIVYDVGASISILLLMIHVWPSERRSTGSSRASSGAARGPGSGRCSGSAVPRTAPPTGRSPGSADGQRFPVRAQWRPLRWVMDAPAGVDLWTAQPFGRGNRI